MVYTICNTLDDVGQVVGGSEEGSSGVSEAVLGLVDQMPYRNCNKWPLMVSPAWGQYLAALAWVSPGQVE